VPFCWTAAPSGSATRVPKGINEKHELIRVPECGQRLTGNRALRPVTSRDVYFKPITYNRSMPFTSKFGYLDAK